MDIPVFACLAFAAIALFGHLATCGLAWWRCRPRMARAEPLHRPGITLVRPLCGLEHYSRETLGSTFDIAYPVYEVVFCIADEQDPILPLAQEIIAAHPGKMARILVGRDRIGDNPKLNNMAKGFRHARLDHIVFVDSNVYTPPDYLDQLMLALERGAGMVSAPPVGLAPEGFWAKVECAFLNGYQARIQYAVDSLGFGFAQGKTLFFRREDLEHGGFAQLANEPAEDAAATKLIRGRGRSIRLAGPFPQLIGYRTASQMWKRQVRWARLRRATFPCLYAPECLAGPLPPVAAVFAAAWLAGNDNGAMALMFVVVWYAAELLLARAARWPRNLPAMMLRDLLLPVIFVVGCASSSFEWHGHRIGSSSATSWRIAQWARRKLAE
jgi:ceramide glucosyltransferase